MNRPFALSTVSHPLPSASVRNSCDPPSEKPFRPVLLLSRNEAYSYLNKFVAVEVTSTIRNIAVEVPLGRAEGLPTKYVANCDNIRTVPHSALTKRIGQLSARRRSEVKRALGHALAWDELIDVV